MIPDDNKRQIFLRLMQYLELEMLRTVVSICEEHGLTYYISGGTYLGAVRHKGFIPWDDDIDIALPREDHDKLLEILPALLPNHLKLVTWKSNADYNLLQAQIWDNRMNVEWLENEPPSITPCWIDLFPLDGVPDPTNARSLWKLGVLYHGFMWAISRIHQSPKNKQYRSGIEQLVLNSARFLKLNKFMNVKKRCRKREDYLRKIPFYGANYCFNAVGVYKFRSIFNIKEVYAGGANFQFEDMMLVGPKDYDFYLTQIYGDYLELPPEEKRNWHGIQPVQTSNYLIGYTQGTFDMLHEGHLNILQRAKQQCDFLFVGVNSDQLVEAYKNKTPVISAESRKRLVESLECVDAAFITETLDKVEVANSVPFNAIFIGDDWKGNPRWLETEELLRPLGIDVVYLPHTDGVSSTQLKPLFNRRIND